MGIYSRLMNSKLLLSLFTLLVVRCEARGRRPGSAASTSAFTEATSAATTDTNTSEDDSYVTLVKGYIDAGTCDSASANSICGDDATSYYKEFEYNGQRVVISNGIPDHTAESDAVRPNENTRCEVWQFMSVPLNPTKAYEVEETEMGVTSLAVTGGTFFNYLSSDDGSVALYNEGDSLDSCMGHSDPFKQYHYHANLLCDDAGSATGANDADQCVLVGYARDGVPLYGFCKDSDGVEFTSCYKVLSTSSTSTITTVAGDFVAAENISDYEYDEDAFDEGSCNLDKASGAIHPTTGEYSYFLTEDYPWTPIYYFGDSGPSPLCSAA